jgi:AraC-like DNA-binding protein
LASALGELEHASHRIQTEDVLVLRVERLLKRRRTRRLSEEEAAHELGFSRRTLVRRLADSNTTFRALLDASLKQRARALLDDGKLSRDEMAEALGFADPTSFSRACRRWFKQA